MKARARKSSSVGLGTGRKSSVGAGHEGTLHRALSFTDCSVQQIGLAVLSEDPDWKFDSGFWCTILTGDPADEFRSFQNRTLGFWIQVYNRWQESGHWNPAEIDKLNCVDGEQLQKLLKLPPNKVIDVIKLFDPAGHRRLSSGTGGEGMRKCKIEVRDFMTAGVVLSRLIATKQKLKFILGLFDKDDSRSLDEKEFANFVTAFIHGLGASFGLRQKEDVMPTETSIRIIVQRLYNRLGEIAASRLKALRDGGTQETLACLAEAIRSHQLGRPQAKPPRQLIPFSTLVGWCFREYQDPLALPYALSIERFCPKLQPLDEDPEAYTDEEEKFYLSHKGPVPVPIESAVTHDSSMLTRKEVVLARAVFQFCVEEGSFQMTHQDLQKGLGREDLSADLWTKLQPALDRIEGERSRGIKAELFSFLRKLCPGAHRMHLRMFDGWLQQFDQMLEQQKFVEACEEKVVVQSHVNNLPIIPDAELNRLEAQFRAIDVEGSGCITLTQIESAMGLDAELLKKYDVSADGFIDVHEFVAMMCPDHWRPPEMSGFDQEVLSSLLCYNASKMRHDLDTRKSLYTGAVERKSAMPASMRPEVPEETWDAWNAVFDRLDTSGDGVMSAKELRSSMLLSQEICDQLIAASLMEGNTGIARRDFLLALLDHHKWRRPGFVMSAAER